jgi:uncharacterized protein (DUF58 family)
MLEAIRTLYCRALDKWLFRLGGPEAGEVYLHQRRVFIMPSRPGYAFFLLLVVLFISAVNYSLSLGFALTFLIAGCAVIDMHLTFRNLAHLYLRPGRTQPVFAGEDAQFELHLVNRRKHDRFAIWIGFIGDNLPALFQPVDVAANATGNVVLGITTRKRGWMPAPRTRLETRFPLGLLRAWSYWQPDVKVLVYPRPEQNAPPLPMDGEGRADGQGRAGHEDFAGIRSYQPGDSMKRLAWRQIARMDIDSGGTLVTKNFEGGAMSELCLDFAALPRAMNEEDKLSRMTRWVLEAEARGLPYAFRLGDVTLENGIGPAQQEACLRALALHA